MRSEADVRGAFNRALHANNVTGQPIESPLTGVGIPDEFVRTTKRDAWIEFKYTRQADMPYTVTYEDGQFSWLTRHWKLGGIAILAVWFPSGLYMWLNERIQLSYATFDCDLHMTSISGRRFIDWLDGIH